MEPARRRERGEAVVAVLESTGRATLEFVGQIGGIWNLWWETTGAVALAAIRRKIIDRRIVFRQMVETGVRSIPITTLLNLFVGLILAMQTSYQLKKFGALSYVPGLVGVSMVRELGPLLAAVIISGRIGAAIAAEIGTMVVNEEVDALKTMGIRPIRYLVAPRLLALMAMLPCLTILADVAGMVGGAFIGVYNLDQSWTFYWTKTFETIVPKDVYTGSIKSLVFGCLVGLISCRMGLSVTGGAEGVGRATTRAVVHSIVAIILADALFTTVFYFLW